VAAESRAECVWEGNLVNGHGTTRVASGAFPPLAVSWTARTERPAPMTSPEELLAAAHASCYCMALSHELTQKGTPPTRLSATAVVTIDRIDGQMTVTTSKLSIRGTVPGQNNDGFREAADAAAKGCPVSRALAGVKTSLDVVTLES